MHQLVNLVVSTHRASRDLQHNNTIIKSYPSLLILVAKQGPADVVIPVLIPFTPLVQRSL